MDIKPFKGPLGTGIDKLDELREQKRVLETKVKEIEDTYNELAESLMARLDAEGADKATGKKATVSISKSLTGQVEDWDKFSAYVIKNKYLHLLQRRLSDPAIRELLETKGKVPGVTPFTKRRLNLRSLSN